jgi:membrane protein DedA with SNARE-associated domain
MVDPASPTATASASAFFNKIAAVITIGGGAFAYGIVFLLLFLAGWLIPLPEEATVIAAGYVTKKYGLSLPVMAASALAGIQGGDLVIFWIGRRHGDWVFRSRLFRRILPEERLAQARKLFAEHGSKMSFFGRFIAGVRLVVFFTAGNLGVPVTTFIFYDFLAILITIPIGLFGGYWFADHIDEAFKLAARSHRIVFGLIILGVGGWYVWKRLRARRAAAAAGAGGGGAPVEVAPPAPAGVEPPK